MTTNEFATRLTDLRSCLEDFQERFNTNPQARKLAKNWTRQIQIESIDAGDVFTLLTDDGELQRILDGPPPNCDDDFLVHLQASNDTLIEIFSGNYNPSTALLDGMLSVFSNDKDKVKLEALAMVIWGL
jgi:putative sterol carrier protein